MSESVSVSVASDLTRIVRGKKKERKQGYSSPLCVCVCVCVQGHRSASRRERGVEGSAACRCRWSNPPFVLVNITHPLRKVVYSVQMQEARSYRGVSRRRDLSTLKIPRRRAEADSVCQLERADGG